MNKTELVETSDRRRPQLRPLVSTSEENPRSVSKDRDGHSRVVLQERQSHSLPSSGEHRRVLAQEPLRHNLHVVCAQDLGISQGASLAQKLYQSIEPKPTQTQTPSISL